MSYPIKSRSVELDPTGRAPTDPGAKLDAGKVRPDLVLDGFSLALLEVAKVATYGATKYSENGWQEVPDGVKRYRAAGDRHRLYRTAQPLDPDTHLAHLAHEAWNRLAELELALRGDHVS
jgi:hypothetical protein